MVWDYLNDPALRVRQVIAAHFLRDCCHIMEIGGFENPVTFHLQHHPDEVLVLDPLIQPLAQDELGGQPCRVRHLAVSISDFDFGPWLTKPFGLVFCGMDLYDPSHGPSEWLTSVCQFLFVLSRAEVAVIEYPMNWQRSADLFGLILSFLQPRIAADIRLDLTRYPESPSVTDEIRSRYLRRLTVLKDLERVDRPDSLYASVAPVMFGKEAAPIILSKATQEWSEVREAFRLSNAIRAYEGAEIHYEDGGLSVVTWPGAWSYAAIVAVEPGAMTGVASDRPQPGLVEVRAYVDAGQLGFGVIHSNSRKIIGERLVKAAPGKLQTIEILVPDIREQKGVLCRNGEVADTASRGRIVGLKLSVPAQPGATHPGSGIAAGSLLRRLASALPRPLRPSG